MADYFAPTVILGFIDGKLHQQFIDARGKTEWRLVPEIVREDRPAAVAGWVAEEDEGDD